MEAVNPNAPRIAVSGLHRGENPQPGAGVIRSIRRRLTTTQRVAAVPILKQQPDAALRIIAYLKGFEPRVADQFERETGLRAARTP